jgi:hypothetical protein
MQLCMAPCFEVRGPGLLCTEQRACSSGSLLMLSQPTVGVHVFSRCVMALVVRALPACSDVARDCWCLLPPRSFERWWVEEWHKIDLQFVIGYQLFRFWLTFGTGICLEQLHLHGCIMLHVLLSLCSWRLDCFKVCVALLSFFRIQQLAATARYASVTQRAPLAVVLPGTPVRRCCVGLHSPIACC